MSRVIIRNGMGGNAWQQPVYYQQQPRVTVVNQPVEPNTDEDFGASASKGLGATQIVCGLLGIILGALMVTSCAFNGFAGVGVWCGIFILISGAVSVAAGQQKSRELIITSLVFSILLCCIFAFGMFVGGAVALAVDIEPKSYVYAFWLCSTPHSTSAIWDGILMGFGLLSWICALAQSIICCKSKVVCGYYNNVGAVVTYNAYPNYNQGFMMNQPPQGFYGQPPQNMQMQKPPDYSQYGPPPPAPPTSPPPAYAQEYAPPPPGLLTHPTPMGPGQSGNARQ